MPRKLRSAGLLAWPSHTLPRPFGPPPSTGDLGRRVVWSWREAFFTAERKGLYARRLFEMVEVFRAARPQVVYLHNLADKHDTHVGVALRSLAALRPVAREVSRCTKQLKELRAQVAAGEETQQSLTEKLTDLKVSLGQISEHRQSLIQTIQSLQTQLQANAGAVAAAESEIKSCADQASAAQTDILASESAVSELFSEKDQKQQNSSQLHNQIEDLLAEQKSNEQTLRDNRAQQSRIEQQINELKIELGQLDVRQQDLTARVRDELQLDLLQSYQNYQDTAVDWEKVREEIAELRGKIERLGNVNLDAIQEQQDLEQRHSFFSTQVEDLNSSKGQLQQLINRLNKVSREKFLETFELVRGHFQQIFRKLFGGGKADIVLEEAPDIDVLDAGIEIVAKPPGKETRSISLLSGGEKAMTAIALLFSVFKAKPSPFCFLDEVDAALDEANNERFDAIVREFQKESQFIIITHSKRTMSVTDMLYGVTMQTQGISKRISVNFDHYSSEPAAA